MSSVDGVPRPEAQRPGRAADVSSRGDALRRALPRLIPSSYAVGRACETEELGTGAIGADSG